MADKSMMSLLAWAKISISKIPDAFKALLVYTMEKGRIYVSSGGGVLDGFSRPNLNSNRADCKGNKRIDH